MESKMVPLIKDTVEATMQEFLGARYFGVIDDFMYKQACEN